MTKKERDSVAIAQAYEAKGKLKKAAYEWYKLGGMETGGELPDAVRLEYLQNAQRLYEKAGVKKSESLAPTFMNPHGDALAEIGYVLPQLERNLSLKNRPATALTAKGLERLTKDSSDSLERHGRSSYSLERHKQDTSGIFLSILVGLIGIFFLSSNITGKAISNLSNTTSSWIGGVLFCVGLVSCFFWVKNKKK